MAEEKTDIRGFQSFRGASVHGLLPGCSQDTDVLELLRVTRELQLRDPDRAIVAAGEAVPDWSGGTRLGESLRFFLDRWGQRGMARGAVVVLFSDGFMENTSGLLEVARQLTEEPHQEPDRQRHRRVGRRRNG
mgnify:CR=1 FL=1